ncbi:MAG: hypothetical protein LPK85_11080 [Gammaproteobacteria bacterium]|nr:hypothetical protein [Gammaproteobacteria bacterium]
MQTNNFHDADNRERVIMNQMYGTYADILFVLFPFLVISLQRMWTGELARVLIAPDLSIAAAILAGLAIGKFVLGLISDRGLGRYKERIVFFIALTLFVVLGPAIILLLRITSGEPVPEFVTFVQPVLLIIAISLYTTAVSISNILTRSQALGQVEGGESGTSGTSGASGGQGDAGLVLPRRTGDGSAGSVS